MAEQIVSRRRVVRNTDDTTGLGIAIAIALVIVALLALFALARGAFNPIPSGSTPNQAQPGMNQTPAGGGTPY